MQQETTAPKSGKSATSKESKGSKPSDVVTYLVKTYGDLLFDLCESMLSDPADSQITFRSILKELKAGFPTSQPFRKHERAWVLKVAHGKLLAAYQRRFQKPGPEEQMSLDAGASVSVRLKQFGSFFQRLDSEDQFLLLLKDKHGIPFPEIASAMGAPEGSLKVKRQLALRALEEWLWENR